jgi:dTDP-4-dehydrorhamnose reductase
MKQVGIHKVLVTGANGQLGWELAQASKSFPEFEFVFVDRNAMDLSNPAALEGIVTLYAPDAIINTAAYTAVDKAETETALAHTINAEAVEALALIAKQKNIPFITFSTDYVFNGNATSPYLTDTALEPVNFYGTTKADGELLAVEANPDTIIIRTSWVFSSHGNNFVKTMMRLMKERDALNIVGDQKGRPTFAKDLALATIKILVSINAGNTIKGIYHFANIGATTWFGFAEKIKAFAGLECNLTAITTDQFPTPAKRPAYSVLDTHKIEKDLGIAIPSWESALKDCIAQINKS